MKGRSQPSRELRKLATEAVDTLPFIRLKARTQAVIRQLCGTPVEELPV
jgi:hypothetical protein